MGLIFSPKESKEFVQAIKYNLEMAQKMLEDLKRGSNQVMDAVGENASLSGTAYEAGKKLFF